MPLSYIYTGFENASPLDWEVEADGTVRVSLLYDHERSSPNRAAGHWHFQLHTENPDLNPDSRLKLILENFDNIWNGKPGSPVSDRSNCFISTDGQNWSALPAEKIGGNRLQIQVEMTTDRLYLARLEPYRLSDLENLLTLIASHPYVAVTPIGKTVEGRRLELVRVGRPDAPYRVLLRARSHPWEPGGNWLVQGLIQKLLDDTDLTNRCLDHYCVYIIPMASKDGVARGHTRFNMMGVDLNRNWEQPADPNHAPENLALETVLDNMRDGDNLPHLAIDLHNDNSGKIHISNPVSNPQPYLANMQQFEQLMRQHTWFTEGSIGGNYAPAKTVSGFRNPGTFGEGLLQRYGIDACILELNCDWITGLQKVPFGRDWELLGQQMCQVFLDYFSLRNPT